MKVLQLQKGLCCAFFVSERTVMNKKLNLRNLILSAMFLALALVLPFLTGQIPQIGSMLLPMHIPVLLCGFFCGAPYGLIVGFVAPLFRSVIFGMPPMFPTALCMAFELAAYGLVSGFIYRLLPKRRFSVYAALILAMVLGRVIWGIAMFMCMGGNFGFEAFVAGALTSAIPGIILQLLLIPILVISLQKVNKN